MPPPFGLMSSQRSSRPASRANCSTTDANASFTSITEMSSQVRSRASRAPVRRPADCRAASGTGRRPRARTRRSARAARARAARGRALLATSTAAAPSQIWRRVPGRDLALRQERRLQRGERLERTCRAAASRRRRTASRRAGSSPRPGRSRSRSALVDRRDRAPVRLERERVELLARELPLVGDHLGRDPLRHDLASARAACPRGRRRSSPSGRATSSRRRPETTRSSCPTRSRPPR